MRKRSIWSAGFAATIALALVLVMTVMAGCGLTHEHPQAAMSSALSVETPVPIVVGVLPDETGSTTWTRTPQVTPADIEPLYGLVLCRGGEVALGLIRDASNRGLLRLRVEPPPVVTSAPQKTGRPFEDARRMGRYRKQRAADESRLQEWREQAASDVESFRERAAILLNHAADAPRTDVCGAIQRADTALAEPIAVWPQAPHRWLVVVSDGQDNAHRCPPVTVLKSGAELLAVNGNGDVGSIAALNPQVFESVRAAVTYICKQERR